MVVLSNLEPNTTYEIRVAAVNGKGQGDYSKIEIFQTLPVRKWSSLLCFLLLFSLLASWNGILKCREMVQHFGEVNYVFVEVFLKMVSSQIYKKNLALKSGKKEKVHCNIYRKIVLRKSVLNRKVSCLFIVCLIGL